MAWLNCMRHACGCIPMLPFHLFEYIIIVLFAMYDTLVLPLDGGAVVRCALNHYSVFPVSTDVPFPKTFPNLCRKILTRLFRVFVHVYIHHFDRIVSIGAVRWNSPRSRYCCRYGRPYERILFHSFAFYSVFNPQEAHVNTCYKHFYYFVREFELISPKELEPLAEMTAHVCRDWAALADHAR